MARLLLIDDDPAVSLTLARMLEFCGHHVTRIESAEAGLEQAIGKPAGRPDSRHEDAAHGRSRVPETPSRRPGLETVPVGVITGDYFLGEAVLQELGEPRATVRYKPIRMEDLRALTDQLLGRGADPQPRRAAP